MRLAGAELWFINRGELILNHGVKTLCFNLFRARHKSHFALAYSRHAIKCYSGLANEGHDVNFC